MLKPSNQNDLDLLQEVSPILGQVAWKGEDGEAELIEEEEEKICLKGLHWLP